jgi:hypothetical protein
MVSLKSILPLAAAGLAIFFLGNAIARPAQAGIGSLLGNIGTGSAQLLNPLFSLKTLIYGETESEASNQVAQIQNASNYTIVGGG